MPFSALAVDFLFASSTEASSAALSAQARFAMHI